MSSGRYGYAAGYGAPQQQRSNANQAPSQYPAQGASTGYAAYGQASQPAPAYASGHTQQPTSYAVAGQQQQQQQGQASSYGHQAATQAYQAQHQQQQQQRQPANTQQQPTAAHTYDQPYRQSTYDPRQQPRQTQAPTTTAGQTVYVATTTTAGTPTAYVVQPSSATGQTGQRTITIPGLTVIPGVTTGSHPTAYVLHSQPAQDMEIDQPQPQPQPSSAGYTAASHHAVGYAPGYTAAANARPTPSAAAATAIASQPGVRSDVSPGARQGSRWAPQQTVQPSQPQHTTTSYMDTGAGRTPTQGYGHQLQQAAYGHHQQPQTHGFGSTQAQPQGYQATQAAPAYKQGQSGYETVPYPDSGAGRTSGFSKSTYPATGGYPTTTTPMVREREPDRRPHVPMDVGKRTGGAGVGRDAVRDTRPAPRRDEGPTGARGFSYDARSARGGASASRDAREPASKRVDRERDRSKERERGSSAVTTQSGRARRSRSRSREKPTAATSPHVGATRKRSPSPVRQRAAEYAVKIPTFSFSTEKRDYSELMRRYTKLTMPSDFASLTASWTQLPAFGNRPADSMGVSTITLDKPARFEHDLAHETQADEPDILNQDLQALPQPHTDGVCYAVRVLLLQGINSAERDSIARGAHRDTGTHMAHALRFVTARYVHPKHKRGVLGALGGFWDPALDGPNPTNEEGLRAAAIRHVRQQTGLDLSQCPQWYRICDVQYMRSVSDKHNASDQEHKASDAKSENDLAHSTSDRPLKVVMYCVIASDLMPSQSDWPDVHASIEAWRKHQTAEGQEKKASMEEQQQQPKEETDQKPAEVVEGQQQQEATEQPPTGGDVTASTTNGKAAEVHTPAEGEQTMKQEVVPDAPKDSAKEDVEHLKEEVKQEAQETTGNGVETAPTTEPASPPPVQIPPPYIHIQGQHTSTFKVRTASTTLYSLLDYDEDDSAEPTFELCCFAECFHEMLMRDYACVIMSHLSNGRYPQRATPAHHGIKQEQPVGEVQDKETESQLSPPAKKPRTESTHRTNMPLLFAFRYFDRTGCSFLKPEDLKRMLHNIGSCLPNRIIKQLVANASSRKTERIYYRELTDTVPESSKSEDNKNKARRSESRDDAKAGREGQEGTTHTTVESTNAAAVVVNSTGDDGLHDVNMDEETVDVPPPIVPPPPPSEPPPVAEAIVVNTVTETVAEETVMESATATVAQETVVETVTETVAKGVEIATDTGAAVTSNLQTAEPASDGADAMADQENDDMMQDGALQENITATGGQQQEDVLDYIEIEVPDAGESDEAAQQGEGDAPARDEKVITQDVNMVVTTPAPEIIQVEEQTVNVDGQAN